MVIIDGIIGGVKVDILATTQQHPFVPHINRINLFRFNRSLIRSYAIFRSESRQKVWRKRYLGITTVHSIIIEFCPIIIPYTHVRHLKPTITYRHLYSTSCFILIE